MPAPVRRLARSAIALLLLSILGCAPSAPASPTWRSGSRLRARVDRTEDGTARFVWWYDRELEIECAFHRVADGTYRCLGLDPVHVVYLDAACTEPAVRSPACAEPSSIVQARPAGSLLPADCDAESTDPEMLLLDPSRRSHTLHELSDGLCGSEITTSSGVIPVVGTVPLSRFVSARLERRPVTARLDVDVLVADDGSEQRLPTFYDRELGLGCWIGSAIGTAPPARPLCMPASGLARDGYHLDATCASSTMLASTLGCEPPALAIVSDDTCTTTAPELREIGPAVTTPLYASQADGSCVVSDSGYRYHEVGAPFDAARLITATATTRGAGRVRVRTFEVDGVLARDDQLVTAEGETCYPRRFSDATSRCTHGIDYADATRFADPACTEPIFGFDPGPCRDRSPPRFALHYEYVEAECLTQTDAVYALEDAPPGPRYALGAAGCEEVAEGLARYLRVAREVPFDTFAPIAFETE